MSIANVYKVLHIFSQFVLQEFLKLYNIHRNTNMFILGLESHVEGVLRKKNEDNE